MVSLGSLTQVFFTRSEHLYLTKLKPKASSLLDQTLDEEKKAWLLKSWIPKILLVK